MDSLESFLNKKLSQEELYNVIESLLNNGYKQVKTSYKQGYISRRIGGVIQLYNGKYGTGYIVLEPCFSSTCYHYISYYTK